LREYKSGARHAYEPIMLGALQPIDDAQLVELAYYLSRLRATTPQPTALYSLRGRCDNSVAIRTEAEKLRPKMCSKLRTQPSGPGDYCHRIANFRLIQNPSGPGALGCCRGGQLMRIVLISREGARYGSRSCPRCWCNREFDVETGSLETGSSATRSVSPEN
jgi:hypothetical protein